MLSLYPAPVPVPSGAAPPPFRRWLVITQYYHPEAGAPQVRLRALVRELLRHGCEVEILTALPNYPDGIIFPEYRRRFSCSEVIDGVPVHRLWLYPAAGRRVLSRLACYLSFSLGAALRIPFLPRPDVVFVEAQPLTLALAGYLSTLLRGVPYIYNTPDLQVEISAQGGWLPLRWLGSAAAALEAFLMRRAFCVSTVTHAFIRHFSHSRALPLSRLTFLPNGADLADLHPSPPDLDYARQLGLDGRTVFTYAGTHAPYHGLEIIIEAAALLRARSDIVFAMIGRGPVRPQLEQRAAALGLRNVVFVDSPFSERRRLFSFTRAAIATVSDMPAAAMMRLAKVMPALACGVPVIHCGQAESAQMLSDNSCGLVVPSRSAPDLAAAVLRLADSPDEAQAMGRRARSLAERELGWSDIVSRWLAQLSLIQAGRDPWLPPSA